MGSSLDDVLAAYTDHIELTPGKYGGQEAVYVPADTADANYRLIVEANDGEATAVRAGRLPEVEWVEGCLGRFPFKSVERHL